MASAGLTAQPAEDYSPFALLGVTLVALVGFALCFVSFLLAPILLLGSFYIGYSAVHRSHMSRGGNGNGHNGNGNGNGHSGNGNGADGNGHEGIGRNGRGAAPATVTVTRATTTGEPRQSASAPD